MNATIEELYDRKVYPVEVAVKVEVIGSVAVSVANRWMLGWPARVTALLKAGTYQTDWDLFLNAMDYRLPIWCRMRMIAENLNELLRYEFYMKNGLPEHHALYDARAHRYAFRERVDVTCDRTTRK